MKLSYTLQIKELCILMFFGFIIGVLYDILNTPTTIKKNTPLQIVIDILFVCIFSALFLLIINIVNDGEIRFFLIIGYILGFIIERISLGKLFAKLLKNMYTFIIRCIKSFSKSKFGRMIFK